jgi:hypothetical protein
MMGLMMMACSRSGAHGHQVYRAAQKLLDALDVAPGLGRQVEEWLRAYEASAT